MHLLFLVFFSFPDSFLIRIIPVLHSHCLTVRPPPTQNDSLACWPFPSFWHSVYLLSRGQAILSDALSVRWPVRPLVLLTTSVLNAFADIGIFKNRCSRSLFHGCLRLCIWTCCLSQSSVGLSVYISESLSQFKTPIVSTRRTLPLSIKRQISLSQDLQRLTWFNSVFFHSLRDKENKTQRSRKTNGKGEMRRRHYLQTQHTVINSYNGPKSKGLTEVCHAYNGHEILAL